MMLRPYASSDLDRVMDIWRCASEIAHPFLVGELDADAELVRNLYVPSADITVAEENSRVLGFVAIIGSVVGALFVDTSSHRRGIGRQLMDHAQAVHGPLSLEVYLENRTARDFYAALGYREVLCHMTDDQGRPHRLVQMVAQRGRHVVSAEAD